MCVRACVRACRRKSKGKQAIKGAGEVGGLALCDLSLMTLLYGTPGISYPTPKLTHSKFT